MIRAMLHIMPPQEAEPNVRFSSWLRRSSQMLAAARTYDESPTQAGLEDTPMRETKKRVTKKRLNAVAPSRHRYTAIKIFGAIFCVSMVFWVVTSYPESFLRQDVFSVKPHPTSLPSPPPKTLPSNPPKESPNLHGWITAIAAIISAIGAIVSALIAWQADRRLAKEQGLRIIQLERQLKEAKKIR